MTKFTLIALFEEPIHMLANAIAAEPLLLFGLAVLAVVGGLAFRALEVYERRP